MMAKRRTKSITPLRGAIVAMAEDGRTKTCVIGVDGKLPWHSKTDMKRFKRRTMGCTVIMGRVTWDSIGNKPLPGRRNVVLSRSKLSGVEHYNSIEKALEACRDDDIWFIGGAQIYHAIIKYLNVLDITIFFNQGFRGEIVSIRQFDLSGWRAVWRRYKTDKGILSTTVYHCLDSD